jgi:hypothetical protein
MAKGLVVKEHKAELADNCVEPAIGIGQRVSIELFEADTSSLQIAPGNI